MKRMDVMHLALSIVMIVVLGIALFFLLRLNTQVAVISTGMESVHEMLTTLQNDVKTVNRYANQNSKVIKEVKERVDMIALNLEMGGSYENVTSGNEGGGTDAFPYVEIWMDKDHTINRTNEENGKGNLGWVVVYNGDVVLQRNAEGEMSYTYFGKDEGAYVIYMTDFVDGQYRVISNVIAYNLD